MERYARGAVVVLIYNCPSPHDEASASSLTITMVLRWAVLPFKWISETPSGVCVWVKPEQGSLGVNREQAH